MNQRIVPGVSTAFWKTDTGSLELFLIRLTSNNQKLYIRHCNLIKFPFAKIRRFITRNFVDDMIYNYHYFLTLDNNCLVLVYDVELIKFRTLFRYSIHSSVNYNKFLILLFYNKYLKQCKMNFNIFNIMLLKCVMNLGGWLYLRFRFLSNMIDIAYSIDMSSGNSSLTLLV